MRCVIRFVGQIELVFIQEDQGLRTEPSGTPEATVEQSYLNVEWSDLNVWPPRFDLNQMRGMWVIPIEQTLFRWMGCEMM